VKIELGKEFTLELLNEIKPEIVVLATRGYASHP